MENKTEQIPQSIEQDSIAQEQSNEQIVEKQSEVVQETIVEKVQEVQNVQSIVQDDNQSNIAEDVESILSKDLDNVFLSMDAGTQQEFKKKGEETTKAIVVLLQSTKVKVKKIINLIISWLRIIPGINKYYIEQEAKIRAEEIIIKYKK